MSARANADAPVIAVDGPAASGKGTIAAGVAAALGFHLLDSGSLYRLVALKALEEGVALSDESALAAAALALNVNFAARTRRVGRTRRHRGDPGGARQCRRVPGRGPPVGSKGAPGPAADVSPPAGARC
jgi:hypothetical protein